MEEKLAKYFSGEATEEERKEILEWRSANESNSESFLKAKNIWIQSSLEVEVNNTMLASILGEKDDDERKVIPIWRSNFMKIAASVIVVLGLTLVIYNSNKSSTEFIASSETIDKILPDGSVVTMHKGSSIIVGDFNKSRNITLKGKAYFQVVRNEAKPFIITSENARVEVLGTSFVVDTEANEEEVEVLVESGLVAFSDIEETTSVKLARGEMGSLNNTEGLIFKRKIVNQNYLAWKTKSLVFDGATFKEVAGVIKDVYDVEVIFENSSLIACKLNGQYENKSSKEVVEIIAQTFGISAHWNGKEVTFKGNACN